ncbi:MAG: VCBS repeat-containing protein [Runella slithyformis]|nr:MAG: VCBS repeat-containing protein [Runella sp.]TAG22979.1 MAG: VCBS repeat-containing protein [Cytophagales bacterium]TAG42034.1 MAG: VCBS repeat-containing protein [Cytophagia bacterium]TAG52809.1 MAG: VCBS repeat-containing protein [Runella slithyformis]TAG83733.1 MAG: VCBS repeat-containing protein [Cytophagales bacterium]
MKTDFNGDGKTDILIASPWGLGIMNLSQSTMAMQMMSPNNTRFGEWLLNTSDNNTELKGDFDGDGKAEILMSSPWGIGMLKLINGNLTSIAMAQNGTRHGGWIINTADNQFLFSADFNRDGKEEVLITSPWGIGMLKFENGQINTLMLQPNGVRFGEWLLNTDDNLFTLVGDFDGDGQIEILATSPWGIGILKFNGTTLTSIAMAANNTRIGDWTVNTITDRFEVTADFDGDGRMEILVSNENKIGILQFQNSRLTTISIANSNDFLGSWQLNSRTDKMNLTGDFDGDGRHEIIVSSDWGLALLKLNGNILQSSLMAQNGTRFGGWLLNTRDNRINVSADFDADGSHELLITSPWGMGILKQTANTFTPLTMSPNGTRFGGWLLNTGDNDLECGLGQSYSLIISHSQWGSAVANTTTFLRNRGYTMYVIPNGPVGIEKLKRLSTYLKSSDRLFVYIAGHGGSSRAIGNTTKSISLTHILQFEDGAIVDYVPFAQSFQLLGNKGVDLAVLDGSCDGGEAVLNAIGERYLAMSTTSVYAPGLTNTPDPSQMMKLFGKPSRFGLWSSQQYTASLLTAITPHRFYQKIYRNDNTEINTASLFYKPAINFYVSLGSTWDLMVRHCYLFKYIYPTEFAGFTPADKDLMTVSANDFIASMRNDFNAFAPSITQLKSILQNSRLVNKAAQVYSQSFPRPWQTIFNDMTWDVLAQPKKHTSWHEALVPGSYGGVDGFVRMVNEILNMLALLEQGYNRQENLLRNIDSEIQSRNMFAGTFRPQAMAIPKITDYLNFNKNEDKVSNQTLEVINQLPSIDRTMLTRVLSMQPRTLQRQVRFQSLINPNLQIIKPFIFEDIFGFISLDSAIAELKSIHIENAINLDKLFYLLVIAEEAVSMVQSVNVENGDLVKY